MFLDKIRALFTTWVNLDLGHLAFHRVQKLQKSGF